MDRDRCGVPDRVIERTWPLRSPAARGKCATRGLPAPTHPEDPVTIQRIDAGPRMSKVVVHGDTVYLAGLIADKALGQGVAEQTKEILGFIDGFLAKAGTDKSKLIAATTCPSVTGTSARLKKWWAAGWGPGPHRGRPASRPSCRAPRKRSRFRSPRRSKRRSPRGRVTCRAAFRWISGSASNASGRSRPCHVSSSCGALDIRPLRPPR